MRKDHIEVLDLLPQAILNKNSQLMHLTDPVKIGPILRVELEEMLFTPITRKKPCKIPWTRAMVMWVRAYFEMLADSPKSITKELNTVERMAYCNMILGTTWSESILRKVAKDGVLNLKLVEDTKAFSLNRETLFNDMFAARKKGYP